MDYWLNQRSVRTAIHAGQPETGAGVFYIGNTRLVYNYDIFDLIPYHRTNIAAGKSSFQRMFITCSSSRSLMLLCIRVKQA